MGAKMSVRPIRFIIGALLLAGTSFSSTAALSQIRDKCTMNAQVHCQRYWSNNYASIGDCTRDLLEFCEAPGGETWEIFCFDNPPGYDDICIWY